MPESHRLAAVLPREICLPAMALVRRMLPALSAGVQGTPFPARSRSVLQATQRFEASLLTSFWNDADIVLRDTLWERRPHSPFETGLGRFSCQPSGYAPGSLGRGD